jgi:hypothetical protein
MPRNDAAAPSDVCPHVDIHVIDIIQPPGIGISPIADMDAHQTIVPAALVAKSRAETPKKARWETRADAAMACHTRVLASAQIVGMPGRQARPLGGGTSIGTEILLAFKPL